MAYNQFYPQTYQPYTGFNPYQQYQQNFQQPQQQNGQIQNGGFVSVRNIEEAYNYPVAPGNSITFKDENAPYVYTKTKGFSQLDQPVFEKYRLVKEEEMPPESPQKPDKAPDYDEQIKLLWDEVKALKSQMEKPKRPIKKEVTENDAE